MTKMTKMSVILFYNVTVAKISFKKGLRERKFGLRKVLVSAEETQTLGWVKSERPKSTKKGSYGCPKCW